jgi:hypothetical protein
MGPWSVPLLTEARMAERLREAERARLVRFGLHCPETADRRRVGRDQDQRRRRLPLHRSSITGAALADHMLDARTRQLMAQAHTKLEVEGYQKMGYELSPDAVDLGLGAALPAQLETGGHTGGCGRARGVAPA